MTNRWINDYALRYAVGTILGAFILAYIYTRLPLALAKMIPSINTWGTGIGLLTAGLAFCYIASSPLLVFHAARWIFLDSRQSCKERFSPLWKCALPSVVIALVLILWSKELVYSALVGVATLLTGFQIYAYIQVTKKRKEMFEFYSSLAKARTKEDAEIVESYRTLREHGNAYSIVVMEVGLGMFLVALIGFLGSPKVNMEFLIVPGLLLACALWVAPAAAILASASRIEIDFVNSKKE